MRNPRRAYDRDGTEIPLMDLANRACRKLRRRPQDRPVAAPVSRFVNLWETETDREQPVLLAHRPGPRKAEALAQPQHGLEPLDGAPGCGEGLKAADPRHVLLHPEVVALDPLLQVLGDGVQGSARQEAGFPRRPDGRRVGTSGVRADPVG